MNLEKGKRKRQTVRGLTTKLINKIKDRLEEESFDLEILEESLNQLIEKENELTQLDNVIEENIEDLDEFDSEVTANQEWRENILSIKSKLKYRIRAKENPTISTPNKSHVNSTETILKDNSFKSDKGNIKLPKLEIKKFSGEMEHWQEFWGQYSSAIHENNALSKIDKFNYLKSLLTSSALVSIQGLTISETNYENAIDILKERFGRKDVVISSHINKLLKLSPVRKSSHLKELRNLYDECITHVRCLESLGIQLNSFGNLLFPILIQLIPDDIVLEFNRMRSNKEQWNIEELMQFLKSEIENREQTFLFRKRNEDTSVSSAENNSVMHFNKNVLNCNKTKQRDYAYRKFEKARTNPTAATLNILSQNECIFCSAPNHKIEDCKMSVPEKKQNLLKQGRCFNCLKKYHVARKCVNANRCQKCNRKHSQFICDTPETESKQETSDETIVSSVTENSAKTGILLQTATVVAGNKANSFKIRCLLDNGSQKTFIDEELSRKLKLEAIGEEYLKIYTFASSNPQNQIRRRVRITLKNVQNPKIEVTVEALEVPNISEASIQGPSQEIGDYCLERGMLLADLGVNSGDTSKVSLLLGSDCYWRIVTGKVQRLPGALVAMETKFGWVLNGTCASTELNKQEVKVMKVVTQVMDRDDYNDNTIKQFWDLEALGIIDQSDYKSDSENNRKLENDLIFENFKNSIKFENNRYIVQFPWNHNFDKLSDNFEIAKARFKGLTRKFKREPQFYGRYKEVIDQYLQNEIAEETDYEISAKTYFMPHQAVIREDKDTTKLRVVYDASSHADNCLSLNDCLNSGPNMYPDILELLLRFRQNRIAFTADIEQAFLQILLDEEDRNSVKFLWNAGELENNHMRAFRMTRVIFGAKSSPFILGATLKIHTEKYQLLYPQAFSLLSKSLYVDDLITGTDDEDEALELYKDIKLILNEGSFNMRKWKTNNEAIQRTLDKKENCIADEGKCKVLGYRWNRLNDTFLIEIKDLIKELEKSDTEVTKRGVLRIIGRLYDPIGFLSPFTVRAKIMLQQVWKHGISWDSVLPKELLKTWKNWCDELPFIPNIEIPRHQYEGVRRKTLKDVMQLHCFTDASQKAYGAVLYLRYEKDGEVRTSFVTSKSRVAPLKEISLPRLELMGAVIGSKLANYVRNKLGDDQLVPYFWTDSSIVLHWIQSEPKKWKPFVQNRVTEIQKVTNRNTWKHCPGIQNPADLLTRGEKIENLEKSNLWWSGPAWLSEDETYWPKFKIDSPPKELADPERRAKEQCIQLMCQTRLEEPLFDITKFSSLHKVLRITGWILRFIYSIRNKDFRKLKSLSAEELNSSEDYWIKRIQAESFSDELQALKNKRDIPFNSKIRPFNPFIDEEGILRLGGRLQNANLNFDNCHPIILPSDSYFSDLLIAHCHKQVGHSGVGETLTQLREKFWVLRGRQRVKTIIGRCPTCRKFKAKPASQDMAPLPPDRLNEAFPFEVCGVDFAGPLYTKDGGGKAYIALFTCAVTRAIHLEIVSNLTTENFLLAFRRFISRRGICKKIYSDNARTFKRADKDLQNLCKLIEDPEVLDFLGNQGIKWKYIVERAAWWGGFWERLVRSTKSCLKKIILKACLKIEELQTVITEIEAILNSRPLTYVYSESKEPEPLTPGHFLIGRRLMSLPNKTPEIMSSSHESLTRRYKYKMNLIDRFWKRWQQQYLFELRSAHETRRAKFPSNLREKDVVLIHDSSQPKLMWKMGLISQIHPGRDGKVRSCTVKLPSGTTLKRPIQLLYPLELDKKDILG